MIDRILGVLLARVEAFGHGLHPHETHQPSQFMPLRTGAVPRQLGRSLAAEKQEFGEDPVVLVHQPVRFLAREDRVAALQGDWADSALTGFLAHLDAAIGYEQSKTVPHLAMFLTSHQLEIWQTKCADVIQPCFESRDPGCAFDLAQIIHEAA
jgi:hypothetical protein